VTSLTSFVFLDGESPTCTSTCTTNSLSLKELPQEPNCDYSVSPPICSCAEVNEFPDVIDSSADRRAMQIILDLPNFDKPTFEGSKDAQIWFLKGLFANIAEQNIYGSAARIFNIDNSVNGAGVKVRIWFASQADCVAYSQYAFGRKQNTIDTATQNFDTTLFGAVNVRMATNPQSKCHKWKYPEAAVPQSALTTYTPNATVPPGGSITKAGGLCSLDEDPSDSYDATSQNYNAIQIIVSLPGWNKDDFLANSTMTTAFQNAWKNYLTAPKSGTSPFYSGLGLTCCASNSDLSDITMEIKAIDNSRLGVGVHVRLHFGKATLKPRCSELADAAWVDGSTQSNALFDEHEGYLNTAVFAPYATANNIAFGLGAPPAIQAHRRATMKTCKKLGSSIPPENTAGGFKKGYVIKMHNV